MAIRHYYNFILYFDYVATAEKDPAGRIQKFSVRVFDSPVGEGEFEEEINIQDWDDLETWRSALAARSISTADFQKFAVRLGELMLPTDARKLFTRSLLLLQQGEGLRIRLRLTPELAFLPWEFFLLEETIPGFKHPALDHRISVVRHEAISIPAPPFRASPYRRVIVAMASPEPYPHLDLAGEQKAIKEKLVNSHGVKAEYYPDFDQTTAPAGITKHDIDVILDKPADVFHFSGHGSFKTIEQDGKDIKQGLLVLAKEHNKADEIGSQMLGNMLAAGNIRLVVLGACESGERDRFQKWSSVALALLRGGIPAVIAMQFSVYDDLTKFFLSKLYENLVAGLEIDEAVNKGRKAVFNEDEKVRDWGTPVLYLRNSGGKIFPPVLDEQARLLALQASDQDTTRDEIYLEWMQERALASPDQLNLLKQGGNSLNLSLVDSILLLKSALVNNQQLAFWVEQLRKTGKEWLLVVNENRQILDEEKIESNAQELGFTKDLPNPPSGVKMLAWSAAVHRDNLVSQTAALALLAAKPENALEEIQTAVGKSQLSKRRQRRARLIGVLAEASSEISKDLPKRLDNFQDRAAVWGWRVRWRIKRSRSQMIRWGLGGAFGAGLALAIWRGFLAIFNDRYIGPEFAIQSYWGFIIGLFMTAGMLLSSPLLLLDPDNLDKKQEKRRTRLSILLGAVGFSLASGLVMWMTGVEITWSGFLTFLLTSFLAGIALGIGLVGQPWAGWPKGAKDWLKRLLLPALLLALLQAPALFEGMKYANGKYILGENQLWKIASIFNDSNNMLTSYYSYLERIFEKCNLGVNVQSYLDCSNVGLLVGHWGQLLSILDAVLTGIVMVVGMLVGMNISETWLGKSWRKLVSRLGFSD